MVYSLSKEIQPIAKRSEEKKPEQREEREF